MSQTSRHSGGHARTPVRPRSASTLLGAALLGAALLGACGGDDGTAPEPVDPAVVGTVSPTGGTLQTTDGKVKLSFPPGAVSGNTEITVEAMASPPADRTLAGGTSYEFGPDGIQFAEPVGLTLEFDPAGLPGSRDPRSARVAKLIGGTWEPLPVEVTVDASGRVTAPISSFSAYGVVADPCWPSVLAPFSPGTSRSGSSAWDAQSCLYQASAEAPGVRQDVYEVSLSQPGALRLHVDGGDAPVIAGVTTPTDGPGTGTVLTYDREAGSVDFRSFLPAGDYRVWMGRDDQASGGAYSWALELGGTDNDAGCGGVGLVPPFSGPQSLTDAADCLVEIQFPAPGAEEARGKDVLEEYYVFKAFAGTTYTVDVAKTGGDAAFAPYPTLFIGGGNVVQPSNPSSPTNRVSWTSDRTRYVVLGVSGGLDGEWRYQQGSYTLSVTGS